MIPDFEVADISGWFMPSGVRLRFKNFVTRGKKFFKTAGPGFMSKVPIVVLINQASARPRNFGRSFT